MTLDEKITQYLLRNMMRNKENSILRFFWRNVNCECEDQVFGTNKYRDYAIVDMNRRTKKYAELSRKIESALNWDMPRVQVVGERSFSHNSKITYNYLVHMFCNVRPTPYIQSNEKDNYSYLIKYQLCESYALILIWARRIGVENIKRERDWMKRMRMFSEFNTQEFVWGQEERDNFTCEKIRVLLMKLLNLKKDESQSEILGNIRRIMEKR